MLWDSGMVIAVLVGGIAAVVWLGILRGREGRHGKSPSRSVAGYVARHAQTRRDAPLQNRQPITSSAGESVESLESTRESMDTVHRRRVEEAISRSRLTPLQDMTDDQVRSGISTLTALLEICPDLAAAESATRRIDQLSAEWKRRRGR